jgi:Secretion system C-terminal sorting domain
MKCFSILLIIFIMSILEFKVSATNLNGRINVITNDGNNYKVVLQINTDSYQQKLGGATVVVDYDKTILSFSDYPLPGVDYTFNNFNMGFYDTAKVSKVKDNQIWLNIVLNSDNHGTEVAEGPDLWTDLVILNFHSTSVVINQVISWNINSKYWYIYSSDNTTTWGNGNFDNIATSAGYGITTSKDYSYKLNQNYPNPFNPTTTIEYSVPTRSYVRLTVYDAIGQEVSVLVSEEKGAGIYVLRFDAEKLTSGIYFYRLQAGTFVQTKKMVILR